MSDQVDSEAPVSSDGDGEGLLPARFAGEPLSSVRARTDAMLTVRYLKAHAGGSEAALHEAMSQMDRTPPSTSTTGQWARGETPSQKTNTRTAPAYDAYGRTVPGYPPTGRSLQAIVRDVAPVPRRLVRPATADHVEVEPGPAGDTVVIDARVHLRPGERFESAAVTGQRETVRDGRRQVVVTIVVTTLALVILLGALAVTQHARAGRDVQRPAGPTSPSVAPSAATPVPVPAGVGVQRSLVLGRSNFCSWRLGTHPIPLVSVRPLTMRIDARCNFPAQQDPGKDAGAAVYSRPTNDDAGLAVGRLGDGSAFTPLCWVRGDRVTDGSEPANASRLWLRAQSPDGYVPDVNVGGGYTVAQLRALGVGHCPG